MPLQPRPQLRRPNQPANRPEENNLELNRPVARPQTATSPAQRPTATSPVRRPTATPPVRRPVQAATPRQAAPPRRRGSANSAISAERSRRTTGNPIADEGLEPWSARTQGVGDPLYYGARSRNEWWRRESLMMEDLDRAMREGNLSVENASQLAELTDRFRAQMAGSDSDILTNAERIEKAIKRGQRIPKSVAQRLGIPAAHADEKLGRALLELSGYDQARLLNDLDDYATDLQARVGNRTVNIDSQKKLTAGPSFPIGALSNLEVPGGAEAFIASLDENTKVLDALIELQQASRRASRNTDGTPGLVAGPRNVNVSGQEGKLMQSMNPEHNPYASDDFIAREELMRKDALLLSDYSNLGYDPNYLRSHGPFNSTPPPGGMTMVDLNALRNELQNMSIRDLQEAVGGNLQIQQFGATDSPKQQEMARARGNTLEKANLFLPTRYVREELANNLPAFTDNALRLLGM